MAIIACPQCNKKISDKYKECPHCSVGTDTDVESRDRMATNQRNRKISQISMQNMVAVIVFMAGFYIMYFKSPAEGSVQLLASQAAVGIGFIWYVVNRIRHFLIKSAAKKK